MMTTKPQASSPKPNKRLGLTKRSETRARYFIREKAQKRGWNVSHPASGGNFLEENEILAYFNDIGLGTDRPDFMVTQNDLPIAVIEAKNEPGKLDAAVREACDYADLINAHGRYSIDIAIGAAGEEDAGFDVGVYFRSLSGKWVPLKSRGSELTAIPSVAEVEHALQAKDGTTSVSIPEQSEFIDAAIELSAVLRRAKVEAPLRPKVIGALVSAMNEGRVSADPKKSLSSVNDLLKKAINEADDLPHKKKKQLIDALELSGADFNRLSPYIGRIVTILNRLNVKAVLQTDTDFLGMFYEAFLRYGYDNNALGIVFTPRHITRFCVRLTGIEPTHTVIDIASGTGGFLVAAFDAMNRLAASAAQRELIRESLAGFDTNPTIWALASLNMFFRGDGKSHIENASCLDAANKKTVSKRFDRAYLNPPFSQDGEPEWMFIDAAIQALKPGMLLAAVVLAGVFADEEHKDWRKRFLKNHQLIGVISLPDDLFYPSAAPTSIIIAQAHTPHEDNQVFMARIWNDGYEKLKGRRVPCSGEQLTEIGECFDKFRSGEQFSTALATTVGGNEIAEGQEWSPQQWLPQPISSQVETGVAQSEVIRSIFRAVVQFPDLANTSLKDFGSEWLDKPPLPLGVTKPLSYFFSIGNGKSSGEKGFPEGDVPYVSSGDTLNSIVRLVEPTEKTEIFENGAISMTAFGQASVQPWPFVARGNGGSSVRVLTPKFRMTVRELVWFAAQINMQRWRFFYLRQAIKGRLGSNHFQLTSPANRLLDGETPLAIKLQAFKLSLDQQSML